jgi:hypothetical protein
VESPIRPICRVAGSGDHEGSAECDSADWREWVGVRVKIAEKTPLTGPRVVEGF